MKYVIIFILLAGCNPVRQVLRSPEKTAAVVWEYLRHTPINSDTVYKRIAGDTVVQVITNSDTTYVVDSSKKLVETVITKYLTKTLTRVDTVTRTIIDRQLMSALQQQNATQAVVIDQLTRDKTDAITSRNKFRLWFWLIVSAISIGSVLWTYFKIKASYK